MGKAYYVADFNKSKTLLSASSTTTVIDAYKVNGNTHFLAIHACHPLSVAVSLLQQ
jgi:hypothetical protein